jgi:hypothetical protein
MLNAVTALASAALVVAQPATPNVEIVHSGLIERYCADAAPQKPNPAVMAEIDQRVAEFQAAWAKEGPTWLAENVRITGRPYQFHETEATLSACPDIASMSAPLLINVVRFTRAYAASTEPPPRPAGLGGAAPPPGPRVSLSFGDFPHVLWHEVTHRYVHDIITSRPGRTTPLLQKYAGESQVTRSHLHLFALDMKISERLGRQADFDRQEEQVKQRGMRGYVRAIEIVRAEGPDKFIAELAH